MTKDKQQEPRLLTTEQLCRYVGLGRNRSLQFSHDIGAEKRIPGIRRVLHDRKIIDAAIDQL